MFVHAEKEDFVYLNAYVKNHVQLGKRVVIVNKIAKQKNAYAMQVNNNVTLKSVSIAMTKDQRKIAVEITKY